MKKAEDILSFLSMDKYVEILAKTDVMGIEEYARATDCTVQIAEHRVRTAESFIACRMDFDCINMNADAVIKGICHTCGCESSELTAILDEYIAELYRSMSVENAPSTEEFFDRVLTEHCERIAAEAGTNINHTPISFTSMLFNPVVKAWKAKWEYMCTFRARLYDNHNNITETSDYGSHEAAVDFLIDRTDREPDKYSRYVLFIRTPFNNEHEVIYEVNGGFSAKHVCKNAADADEWKAVFYDYTDREINTFSCSEYISQKTLMHQALDMGAMYYVLTYRGTASNDYTVQYFKVDRNFHNPDVVSAIEGMFLDNFKRSKN